MQFSKLFATLLSLSLGAAASFIPARYSASHASRTNIHWNECGLISTDDLNNTRPILCGSISVPLDYSDPASTSTVQLPLLKIPALNSTAKKNSILFNFGGPGIGGTSSFQILGARLQGILGPDHDLITWHPRGTDGELLFSCYLNNTDRAAAAGSLVLGNASNVANGQLWANGQVLSDNCAELQRQNGSLIGSAFTARDAMQIVDAVQDDGLIRYWGFSYGTALGATIAAMFPDRIGRLVLDGVVNPLEYYHGLVLTSRASSDDVLRGFGQGCVQVPERCSLAQNRTAEQVYRYVLELIEDARASPIVFTRSLAYGGDFTINYSNLKSIVYSFLYIPENWPLMATLINAIATKDTSTLSAYIDALTSTSETDAEAEQGIYCSDTLARASTLGDALTYFEPFETNSFYDVDSPVGLACARWPFAAKERYTGDFRVKTRHPLLVISNTWDPATPLSSGRNASAGFEGSVLLEQHGYGHCSSAQASLCTSQRIRAYFNNGTLPQPGTICEVDEPFFPSDAGTSSWANVLTKLAAGQNNGTSPT